MGHERHRPLEAHECFFENLGGRNVNKVRGLGEEVVVAWFEQERWQRGATALADRPAS